MENTDYHKLCLEIFGTDEEKELRQIAENVKKNPRNAGRKKKFSDEDISEMKKLLSGGMSMAEIAKKYDTSRQVVNRYLNPPLSAPYTMRMYYMFQQKICTTIDVDFMHEKISIQNRTSDLLHRAFGIIENPTWDDFQYFLQDRCFPPTRGMLDEFLGDLGLDSYDPLQIVEKTHGRTAEDHMWIRFEYRKLRGGQNGKSKFQ